MNKLKLTIVFYLLLSWSLQAQESNGIIKGLVFNEKNNEPVEFASVAIYETSTGTGTDIDGNFEFTGVKPGYVKIAVSSVGFETYVSEEFLVTNVGQTYLEIPLRETFIKLDEVVVKASPFRRNQESPISLRRIGIAEIEKNPGGNRDISRVIQTLPGVSSSPNFRNDVIVRGGGSSENRFYLDDVEIPNLNHFATQGASGGPVGIINVDFIREVNLYSGAFPAERGNALSSILEMKQIEGNKDRLKFRGSVGASDLALTLDGPIGDNTTFISSFRRSYLQFLFSVIGLPFLPTYNDFQFKTRTKIDKKNEITFIGLGALDLFDLNLDANETVDQRYILEFIPVNEQWSYTIGSVFKHYGDIGYHTFVLSRNHLNNIAYKHIDNNVDSAKTLDYSSQELENKFRYEKTFRFDNGVKLTSGINIETGKYINNTYRLGFINNQPVEIDYSSELLIFNYGIFSQISQKVFYDKLSTSFGFRMDGSDYDKKMSNPLNQFSPRLSLSYELSKLLYLNFNTGIYYQRPSYTTLGYKDSNDEFVNKQNNISYIQSKHLVSGIELRPTDNTIFTVEGFYKLYQDYPFSVNDSVPISSKGADFGTFGDEEVLSISEGRAYGIELLARSLDLFGFNTLVSYTWVRSEFKSHDQNLELTNNYIPTAWDNRHILNITTIRSFKGNWDIGLKWRYVAGAPYTPLDYNKSRIIQAWDAQNAPYLDYSRFNQERLGAFHQLDLRVDKSFFFNKWSLMTYIDIQNVYNFKSDEPERLALKSVINGTSPGEDVIFDQQLGQFVYDLQEIPSEGQGTVLPTIGIIVEF